MSSELFPSSSTFIKMNVLLFNLPSWGSDRFPAVPVALAQTNNRCRAESCFSSIGFPNEPAATVKPALVAFVSVFRDLVSFFFLFILLSY